ncbi:hypothetical protein [Nostoc sp. PA-18-2419]|uniref:hypothetical protein n=1 Tax=Nostoc sp. PA-18-2419 TaxID=2575443 RepID=UPI00167513DD|nr:hypothetical protein [Nostoc sp. PA-18-2419]
MPTNNLSNGILLLPSEVLELELCLEDRKLRFYNPATDQILLTHEDEVVVR